MEVTYGTFTANNQTVQESQASSVPNIKLYPFRYSTLVMYDPDSVATRANRTSFASKDPDATVPSYLHYLVINIKNGDIVSGDVIVPYVGPTPPPGSGTHRYIFEQLEQTSPFNIAGPERSKFDISNFKKMNNLALKASKMFRVSV